MPEFTHICHTLCLKYGQIYKPGDRIRLKKGDQSPYFKTIRFDEPEEETPADPGTAGQNDADTKDTKDTLDFEEQLKELGEDKDKLEAFAKERYDVDLDKRKAPKNLIEEIRELEDIRNLDMN